MKRLYMAIGFAVLLVVGGVVGRGGFVVDGVASQRPAQGQRPAGPSVPVIAAPVVQKPMPVQVEAIGTVQTITTVVIRARVDTQIDKVLFKDGDAVKAGDVLFQ